MRFFFIKENGKEEVEHQESGEEEEENEHEEKESSSEKADSDENREDEKKDSEAEDSDDEVISRKREKKNDVDVFGEELDDLSDDSEDDGDKKERKDSDEGNNEGEDHEESQVPVEEEEVEPEQIINIEMPKVNTDLGKELHFVKLPNFLSVEPRPFDPDTYEDDLLEKSETLDEEGIIKQSA